MSRELGGTRKDGTPELEVQSNQVNIVAWKFLLLRFLQERRSLK